MELTKLLFFVASLFVSFLTVSQQSLDNDFVPQNAVTVFSGDYRPMVAIDQAHNNYHTLKGRFKPFADILSSTGFNVVANTSKFSDAALVNIDILVIANALHDKNIDNWDLPNYSAFEQQEIESIYQWVKDGGALFLIADHMPWPAASSDLASIFGFGFSNGYVEITGQSKQFFSLSEKSLVAHPLLELNSGDPISEIRGFLGQGFLIPPNAVPVLQFIKPSVSWMPAKSWDINDDTPQFDATGFYQGATLQFGKGRVAFFGEAGMFTAQIVVEENETWKLGLNAEDAPQNEQFLLNIMYWLAGEL